jgi:pyridoxal phosphate-dependent aminotransferase EpsN
VAYRGATPVFIDSEENSWNMDPALLEEAVRDRQKQGKRIKAAIIVHLYGQSADLDALRAVCAAYDIACIEDAAESLGATYKGKHTGTIGDMGVFSFNGNKIVTTSGGGMLVAADRDVVARARFFATQARDSAPHYEHSHIGYNYRLSNICAAIGRGQIAHLQERVTAKRRIFDFYRGGLSDITGVSFMPEPAWGRANRWLTCLTIDPAVSADAPERVREALEKENIESRPLWKPMHLQPVFASCPAYVSGVSQRLFERGLCLPSGTGLTQDELDRVVACVRRALLA